VYPYIKNEGLFTCPSNPTYTWTYSPTARDNSLGYGMNYRLTYYYLYLTSMPFAVASDR
jgi:hypothetical protein